METRLLILNADPVFQDEALGLFSMLDGVESRIARTLPEAVAILLAENFDAFVVEGEAALALEQCTNARQHFPSLNIVCLSPRQNPAEAEEIAQLQNVTLIFVTRNKRRLERNISNFVNSLDRTAGTAAEGVDPCHSLIGNLNQFSAAEILQMSCLSQRSGRFTFKSGRGNSEIYLQHGSVRHAVFGQLEGESAGWFFLAGTRPESRKHSRHTARVFVELRKLPAQKILFSADHR